MKEDLELWNRGRKLPLKDVHSFTLLFRELSLLLLLKHALGIDPEGMETFMEELESGIQWAFDG